MTAPENTPCPNEIMEPLRQIEKFQENKKYLSGIKLPPSIQVSHNLLEAIKDVKIIFFVVPSCVFLTVWQRIKS